MAIQTFITGRLWDAWWVAGRQAETITFRVQTYGYGCTNAPVRTGNYDNAAIGIKLAGIDKGHDRGPPLRARPPVRLP